MVGRIIAVDAAQRFAFVELASDAPAGATADGTDLCLPLLPQTPPPKTGGDRATKPGKPGAGGGTRGGSGKGGGTGRSNQRKPTSGQKRPKKPGLGRSSTACRIDWINSLLRRPAAPPQRSASAG